MRIAAYLAENGIDQVAAARALGCSKSYLSRLCNGLSDPSLPFARKVRDWSGGAVALNDWPGPVTAGDEAKAA